LEQRCLDGGHPAVHARALFRAAYKELAPEPWAEPTLPKALAAALAEELDASGPALAAAHVSGYDRSVKFLVALADGREVEAVLMPEKRRLTLCVSSQVGCAQGCVFCHTGRMGLVRHLTAGEIVGQLVLADRWLAAHPDWLEAARLPRSARLSNVVFMGMGEPLDNVDAVATALEILTDPLGPALGLARISVSTAGHLDGLDRLLDRVPKARLALSVHSADEQRRSRLMPINRRWPLTQVLARIKERQATGAAPVLLQYTLIAGVNDGIDDAYALAALTAGLAAKVNLIPLNEVEPSRLAAPAPDRIQAFRDVLHAAGLRVMVRYSKGQDIAAACGQLVVKRAAKPLGRPANPA
jgi:23S rRNA (adenine2503-C2)-methyltransferase